MDNCQVIFRWGPTEDTSDPEPGVPTPPRSPAQVPSLSVYDRAFDDTGSVIHSGLRIPSMYQLGQVCNRHPGIQVKVLSLDHFPVFLGPVGLQQKDKQGVALFQSPSPRLFLKEVTCFLKGTVPLGLELQIRVIGTVGGLTRDACLIGCLGYVGALCKNRQE